ncbi:NRDE family protein [Sinomicrobium oceani]|uniref:NRDE family protein n=1 Tax=Sinomicrobium oceani TaxID=1150368 RepID=UPI00227AB688|nr:NRDE family protein [Sinomicrobium oceani]
MCTVTFVHTEEQVILTSNRDESIHRSAALPPHIYTINHKRLAFPKDGRSGGSWFATDSNGITAIVLNGAEAPHTPQGPYRKSRGLLLLDIISHKDPITAWKAIAPDRIEPFTILLFRAPDLTVLQWNGTYKKTAPVAARTPYILSSSTLYTEAQQEHKKQRFNDFLTSHSNITPDDLLQFHQTVKTEDTGSRLPKNPEVPVATLSITQCILKKNEKQMRYLQLFPEKKNHTLSF